MGFIRLTKLFVVITTACHVIHEHSSIATTIDDGHLMYLNKNGLSTLPASATTSQNVIKIQYPRSAETVSTTAHKPKKNPHPPVPAPTQSPTVESTPAEDSPAVEDGEKDQDPKTLDPKSPISEPSAKETPPPADDAAAPETNPPADEPIIDDSKTQDPESDKKSNPSKKPSPAGKPVLTTKPERNNHPTQKPTIATIPNSDKTITHQTPTKKPLVADPSRKRPSQKPFKSPTVPEDAETGLPSDDSSDESASKDKENKDGNKNNKKNKKGDGDNEEETPPPAPSKVKAKPTKPTKGGEDTNTPVNGSNETGGKDIPEVDEDEPPPTKEPSFSEGGGQNNNGNIGGADPINVEIANEDKTALNSAKYFSITFVLCLIFCGLLYTFRRYAYN